MAGGLVTSQQLSLLWVAVALVAIVGITTVAIYAVRQLSRQEAQRTRPVVRHRQPQRTPSLDKTIPMRRVDRSAR